jgi:2,5-dihydroxypyridine 5,6-dioxygenase
MKKFPLNYSASTELIPLFKKTLELCNLKAGETLLIYADTHTGPHYPAAALGAALELGAEAFEVTVPTTVPENDRGILADIWGGVDMVLDLVSTVAHAYSLLNAAALENNGRVLRCGQPQDVLMRLSPDPVIRRRAKAGAERLKQATTMRVTSEAGTDLTVNVKDRVVLALYSLADEPGRWDNWPSGMVAVGPDETSANGTLVLDLNDVILRLGRYVTSPVKMTLRDGKIVSIEGGAEARLLQDWFASFGEEDAYRIAHIGWGCEHRADWNRMGAYLMDGAVQDQEAFYGNMQIAFGSNTAIFQGSNACRAHMDFPCRNNSIWLDGEPIMEKGQFLVDEMKCGKLWRIGVMSYSAQPTFLLAFLTLLETILQEAGHPIEEPGAAVRTLLAHLDP